MSGIVPGKLIGKITQLTAPGEVAYAMFKDGVKGMPPLPTTKHTWAISLLVRQWPFEHKAAWAQAYTEEEARATVCTETYEILSIRKLVTCPACGHSA